MEQSEILLKIIVEGVRSSGKTSLMTRYIEEAFRDTPIMTIIGPDFRIKKIMVNKMLYKLQIWEKPAELGVFRTQLNNRNFYRAASGVICVFDCMNHTLENLENSIIEMRKYLPNEGFGVPIVVAYSKIDLINDLNPPDRLISLAKEQNLIIVCCSSKTGVGVDQVFTSVLTEMNSMEDYWKKKEENELIDIIKLKNAEKINYSCF